MKKLDFLSSLGRQCSGQGTVTKAVTVGSPSAHRRGAMLKLISVLVLILTIGIGQMWATEAVYKNTTFNSTNNSKSVSSYTESWSNTTSGFQVNLVNANNNNNGWSYIKMGRKNNASVATIITNSAIDKKINKVSITIDALTASKINSIKLYKSTNGSSWTELGSFTKATGAQNCTIAANNQAANLYYKLEFDCASGSSNGLITVSAVNFYAETYTVTYDSNGGSGSMTDGNSPYFIGSTVTVLSNSFSAPANKEFDEWKTGASSGTSYAPAATFNISANTTLYAQWKNSAVACTNEITITKGTPSNGSFDITGDGNICIDGGNASATISNINPTPGYRFKEITSSGGGTIDNSAKTVTNISANTTINVVFEQIPSHKAYFYNGATLLNAGGTSVQEGVAVSYSGATPTSCETGTGASTTFAGWATATWDGKVAKNEIVPDFYEGTLPVMGENDVTYHAVFCKGGNHTVTITNADFTGSDLTNSYTTITITKTIGTTDYNFEINACKQNSMCQLRDNATLSYIEIPELPGVIKSIATTECSNAASPASNYSGTLHLKSSKTRGNSDTYDIAKIALSNVSSFNWDLSSNTTHSSGWLFTSAGLRIKDLTITYGTETSNYMTTCCQPLGQINGSVSLSQLSTPDPKRLKATWSWGDNPDMTGIAHSIIKLYNAANDELAYTSGNIANNVTTYEVPADALTPCTEYYATITTVKDEKVTTCCAGVEHGKSETNVSTIGYTYTNSSTNVNLVAALPASTCANGSADVDVQFTAATGYRLPATDEEIEANVSVTNAGEKDADWFCSVANNVLTISLSPSKATGNIDIQVKGIVTIVPEITVSTDEIDFDEVKKGVATSTTFTVEGANLNDANITLSYEAVEGDNVFTFSKTTLTPSDYASPGIEITLTANTSTVGDYAGTITISDGNEGAADKSIDVYLTVLETYTVNWFVNGTKIEANSKTDVVGTAVTAPSDFSAFTDCSDFYYVGWATSAITGGSSTSKPTLVTPVTEIGTDNLNYYAVFADGTPASTENIFSESLSSGISTTGWTFNAKCYTLNSAVRMSTGDDPGVMTSPAISALDGDATLTFEVKAWSSTENGKVTLSASKGTFGTTNFTTSSSEDFEEVSTSLSGGDATTTITFTGTAGKRISIKNVKVTKTVAENFSKYYTTCPHVTRVNLSAPEVSNGSISFAQDSKAVTSVRTDGGADVVVDVVASPATGYELTGLTLTSEDVTGATKNQDLTQITIPETEEGTLTVTATFGLKDYVVTVNQTEGAGATLDGATDEAHYGETINLSATNIPANAQFVNWTSSDVTITNSASATEASFTMPAKDVTVTANFLEIHNVAWAIENTPASGKSDFVYVKGIVTNITDIETTQYYNATYYISDLNENGEAVNSYLVFRAKREGNTNYTSNTQLKEGDEVIVYGKLTDYQGTKEFEQGGYIITNGRTAATFNVVVSGPATKTDYYLNETFAFVGLTAKAEYSTGYKKNVTEDNTTIWKANDVATLTVTEAGTINVTATWNETTSEAFPVTVTVTTKVLESIELSETALTGYKGIALPKPTTVTAHFDDQGVQSTSNVTAFAIYDENDDYDASLTSEQTIEVKYGFGLNTETANYTVTLSPVRNTLETAYTVAKGREIIDVDNIEGNNLALDESANKVFVAGRVTAVSGNTYTIKDNAENAEFIEIYEGTLGTGISSVMVGDLIKVEGNFFFYENNTHTVQKYRITNGEIVAVVRTPEFSIADVAEMEVNITADLGVDGLTIERGGSEGAITFRCTDPAVTIVENKLHAAAAGDATVTATMAANGEGAMSYAEATTTFDVHVIAERKRYAVSFNGNEADGGTAPTIANQLPGATVDLPANTYAKTDYRFTGWVVTETESGDAVEVEAGHFTMPEAAVTVTAQWEAKSYCALTLRVNGVDQPAFNVERLEAYDLAANEKNPSTTNGYDFYGWAVLDGDVEEEVTEAIAILPNHIFTPAADEESKTLYAVFTKSESGANKHYELDYEDENLATNTNWGAYATAYDYTAADGGEWTIKAYKNNGMQINVNVNDPHIKVPNCPANIIQITLTCNNSAKNAVKFAETIDGESIANGSASTSQTLDLSGESVTTGYILPTGNCQITHIDVEYNGNFTYYTTRPVVRYTVTYDANDGENAPAASKTDVNSKVEITADEPTREDWYFNGWKDSEDHEYNAGQKVTLSADLTLYAQWREKGEPVIDPENAVGTIGGKFICTEKGDTAVFSRGNLRYNYGADQWYFAEHQYDLLADENLNFGKASYTGDIDLFGWSNSTSDYGRMRSNKDADYMNSEFKDWGALFTGETKWRTFSKEQINSVLKHQKWTALVLDPTPENDENGDEIRGIALFPYDWVMPAGYESLHYGLYDWNDEPKWADNTILPEKWAALEEAGAVYLPMAGARAGWYGNHIGFDGATESARVNPNAGNSYCFIDNVGWYGYYWLTNPDSRENYQFCANYLIFMGWGEGPTTADDDDVSYPPQVWSREKRRGNSVRLVNLIPRRYTVTYDKNGGTGDVPTDENTYLDGAKVTVAGKGNLAKEGYAFAGWKFKEVTYKAEDKYTIENVLYNENIVFEAQWNAPSDYVLVTKATQLADGDQIIIAAAGDYDYAMGEQNGDIRRRVEIAKTEDKKRICLLAEDPVVFTLGVSGDYFTFYKEGEGFLCATSSGSNNIGTKAELDNNGKWAISVSTDANSVVKASVVAQGTYSRNTLQYNSGSPRFSCYGSATQQAVALYKIPGEVTVTTDKNKDASDIATNSSVTVVDGATLTIDEDKQFDNLIVEAGGVVEFNDGKDLDVKDLTINSEAGKSGQVTSYDVNVNGDIYLEIKLCDGAMDAEASRKWYCISAPFDVNMNGGFFWGDGTPMVLNTHFQMFEYQGEKRARTGNGWQRVSGTMKANTAYFIGFDDERIGNEPGMNQNVIKLKANANTIPTAAPMYLVGHDSEISGSNDWYGLANPALHYVGINMTAHVFECEVQGYDIIPHWYNFTGFVVGTPFFVQAKQENLTFDNDVQGEYRAPKRQVEEYTYCVEISREGASRYDNRLFVRASEDAESAFVQGKDEITLNSETSKYGALIWTKNYGMRLAIEDAPFVGEKASYELGIYAPAAGEYAISVAAPKENADLYLTKNGMIIWNLSMNECTLDLNKGANDGYGLLLVRKAPQVSTGVESTEFSDQNAAVQKVIIDEHVYILREGQMYDVTGKMVK